jgi:small subunit ribosomal protein S20
MAKEEKAGKKKRPTAEKRILQSTKQRLINKSFKSEVRTAIRAFESALKSREQTSIQTAMANVYSMMDRGCKRGVFKKNKASRLKARAAAKAAQVASST